MSIARAVAAMSWRDMANLVQYTLVAAAIEVGLRTLTLPRLCRFLHITLDASPSAGPIGSPVDIGLSRNEARKLVLAGRLLRRRPFDDTCLRRAMLGAWILRTRDHAIRIGVVKAHGVVRAHSWLELDGISLEPDAVTTFKLLTPLGGTVAA